MPNENPKNLHRSASILKPLTVEIKRKKKKKNNLTIEQNSAGKLLIPVVMQVQVDTNLVIHMFMHILAQACP